MKKEKKYKKNEKSDAKKLHTWRLCVTITQFSHLSFLGVEVINLIV